MCSRGLTAVITDTDSPLRELELLGSVRRRQDRRPIISVQRYNMIKSAWRARTLCSPRIVQKRWHSFGCYQGFESHVPKDVDAWQMPAQGPCDWNVL